VADIDINALILSEHEVFRRDFDNLEQLSGTDELRAAWQALADQLEVHASGEEAVFYPHVVREAGDVEDTKHALQDHNEIREAAQAVDQHEVGSDDWWAAVRRAREVNGEHMEEEEREILPSFRDSVGTERRTELGMEWLQFHDEHERAKGLSGDAKDPEAYVQEQEQEPA
jgi:hypothetical protein